ncbi:MAG: hypothetical protein J6Q26_03680 [Bacteroidales bacterium]|nr:hypothetical protein [Bacteroidales bacterium]
MLIFKTFTTFLACSKSLRFSLQLANFSVPHYISRRFVSQGFLRSSQSRCLSNFNFSSLATFLASFVGSQIFPLRTTFLAATVAKAPFVGSQSRMRLGKENKPWLVFFSLSFVFGRFESKLSSGLQLRIKNQANLFYLRSPFTTFVPYK